MLNRRLRSTLTMASTAGAISCQLRALIVPAALLLFATANAWSQTSPSVAPGRNLGPRVKDHALPNVATTVRKFAHHWHTDRQASLAFADEVSLKVEDGRVHVTIRMLTVDAADAAVDFLVKSNAFVSSRYRATIDAWVPIDLIWELNSLDGISTVHQPMPPLPMADPPNGGSSLKAGGNLSQGVPASNADVWHASGVAGSGVSIAVVDSFQDLQAAIDAGELPSDTSCYPNCGSLDISSRQGTACAEIIHDMAPSAALTVTSVSTSTEFAQRIGDLAAMGQDVISASIGFVDQTPGDGTGDLADAIAQARSTHGTLFVGSAGNHAHQHWDGYFDDSDGDDYHEFPGGSSFNPLNGNTIIPAGTEINVYLRWEAWPATDQDFDLELYYWDGDSWEFVNASDDFQDGTQPPWEWLVTTAPSSEIYALAITKWSATTSPAMDLMVWAGPELMITEPSRSIVEPATAPDSISIAAVDASSFAVEDESSRGPTHGPGGSLSGGDDQPRISGYANVDTWSYGPGLFGGASSACPHVAGAAGLVLSAYPEYTASEVQTFLEGRAIDGGASGYDHEYGHGRLWLGDPPTSCSYSLTPISRNHEASGGTGTVDVTSASGCTWSATSNDPGWITITNGADGSGSGTVTYSVSENTAADPRTGTLTIAGQTFTVVQSGTTPAADFSLSDNSPDIGETVTFTAAPGIQPVSWNFGGQNCDGQNPQVDCSSVPGDCRTMQWEWVEAGTKAVTMVSAGAGEKTHNLIVNNTGSCPVSCDATGPPSASFTMAPNPASINETVTFTDTSTGAGPNAPTDRLWTVRKGGQVTLNSTSRVFTHQFDVDGIYQVELEASNCGYSESTSRDLNIQPEPQEVQGWVLPSAVRTAGLNNTVWKTDLSIFNGANQAAPVDMVFLPADTNNTQGPLRAVSIVVPPKHTRIIANVMSVFPGVPTDGVKGSIWIAPESDGSTQFVIGSRTYNDTPEGTFGQFVPAVPLARPSSNAFYFTGLAENDDFRTNIGLVNLGTLRADGIALTIFDEQGNRMGNTVYSAVLPGSSTQIVRVARTAGITSDLDSFSLKIALNGKNVSAYASVVDNVTGDPVFLSPGIVGAYTCHVPGLAHLPGLNSSIWRSDITYFNPTGHHLDADFRYFPDDYSGWVPSTSISLSPMEAILMTDVIGSISHPGGANSKGHILVSGTGGRIAPMASARTYNLDPEGGTFGQNVFVFDRSNLIEKDQGGYMPGVCNSADGDIGSRTNIGIVNAGTGGLNAQVLVTFWTETGTIVVSSVSVDLGPDEMYQTNLFDLFGIAGHDLCGTARVMTLNGGPVAAYASIVDNRTQDPIMVPAVPAE